MYSVELCYQSPDWPRSLGAGGLEIALVATLYAKCFRKTADLDALQQVLLHSKMSKIYQGVCQIWLALPDLSRIGDANIRLDIGRTQLPLYHCSVPAFRRQVPRQG